MEVEKSSPSGQQQPVGTEHLVEQIVTSFLALPFEDQQSLLLIAASEIVPRLTDLTRDEFIDQLRHVPMGDGRLAGTVDEQLETHEEVWDDWVRQSMGAQKHILELVGPRVIVNLRGPDRDRYLWQMSQAIGSADDGNQPTIH